jgi:cobalt-zinc-cadmium efflux system protein
MRCTCCTPTTGEAPRIRSSVFVVHEHEGHSHAIAPNADARRLGTALALIVGFMAVEVVAGILAHSLSLVSDAAHMLTDAGALILSLVVLRLLKRPAAGNLTFGLQRMDVLSAQANGATLLVLSGLIFYGAVRHLISPPDSGGWTMLVVALLGVVVNLLATREVAQANRSSLNVEGAFQHLLTDLVAFFLTAVAGLVIIVTGFVRADALAALAIALIMLRSAIGLLRASGRVLLEIAPERVDVDEVGRTMASYGGVTEVHDLHVWEISSGFPALSAHILVDPDTDCHGVRRELEQLLGEQFGIEHTTLQVDHAHADRLLQIGEQHSHH